MHVCSTIEINVGHMYIIHRAVHAEDWLHVMLL